MYALWDKYGLPVLIWLTFLIVLISTIDLASDIGRPYGGLLTYYNPITSNINISADIPLWLPGLAPGRATRDDVLKEIDGQPYTLQSEIQTFANARKADRKSVEVVVYRNGSLQVIDLPVVLFSFNDYINLKLPSLLISLGFWLVSITVYSSTKSSLETVSRVLILLACFFSINFGVNRPSLFCFDGWVSKMSDLANIIQGSFIGIALIHFSLVFPRPLFRISRKHVMIAYGLGLVIATAYLTSRWLLWTNGQSPVVAKLDRESFYMIWRIVAVGAILLILRCIWMIIEPGAERRQRREGFGLLLGLLLAMPFTWSSILNALAGWSGFYWKHLDLRFLFLAMPSSFAIVTLRYHTFRSSPPILLIVPLLAISGFVASAGSAVLFEIYPQIVEANRISVFGLMFSMTTTVSLLWSTQSSWRGLFGKLLYWEVHNYNAIKRFNQRLIHQWNLSSLPEAVSEVLCNELELEQSALWLWDAPGNALVLASYHGDWKEPPPKKLATTHLQDTTSIRPLRAHSKNRFSELSPYAEALPDCIQILLPLVGADSTIGLLAIGRRWDKATFDEEDIGVLEIIGSQTSLFLLAAIQIAKLQQVPYQLYQVQESEREKIARELHDTIQQFLGRLPFYLEVTLNVWKENRESGEAMFLQRIDEIKEAAHTLRSIRNDLAPIILQTGIHDALITLCSQFSKLTNTKIDIEIPPEIDDPLSIEAQHAIYRVVQQALDNISTHARADTVQIYFRRNESDISFQIADNGVGFSKDRHEQAALNGSIGLSSMQHRVETLGGMLEVMSELGEGTTIRGSVPTRA